MTGMEVDPSPDRKAVIPPRDRILQRLAQIGVPQECLDQSLLGLAQFITGNRYLLPDVVSSILPSDADVSEVRRLLKKASSGGSAESVSMSDLFGESMLWLQYLMFDGDPEASMNDLAQQSAGQRAVCGAVWGQNDLAYRCRTCENDSTCAICVPCFQNGNHKDHDYSIIYTGGGCCDCGDETAWKHEGFCSRHKGSQQIQRLPEELADSIGPVLDALLACWRDKLLLAEQRRRERESDRIDVNGKIANELSSAVVEMLLDFCNSSESLLSLIARRTFECNSLLEVLVRAERFLDRKVLVKKLHELLLKLLGEPLFKDELAKVYINYYPFAVSEIIKEGSDSMLEKYPMLPSFSVQIFTVPTLTPKLVREANLLGMVLGCLRDLFNSCIAEDGRLQASKWANLYETTIRLIEDTRYIMSHKEIPKYIINEQPDISRTWIWLLGLVQGVDAQKRVTGLLTEEENEYLPAPFVLTHYLGNVSKLLVEGAFSVADLKEMKDDTDIQCSDGDKRQRISQENSACTIISGKNSISNCGFQGGEVDIDRENCLSIPSSVTRLILEFLRAIESCLVPDTQATRKSSSFDAPGSSGNNICTLRKKLFKIRKGTSSSRVYRTSTSRMDVGGSQVQAHVRTESCATEGSDIVNQNQTSSVDAFNSTSFIPEHSYMHGLLDDSFVEFDSNVEAEAFSILSVPDWPDIAYDVSSEEISFHIPLHRALSLLLRKAMRSCYIETGQLDKRNVISAFPLSVCHHDFFCKVLGGLQPYGFSAFIMEHPLRLSVFCAQVRAGMWRKNGDAAILSSNCYRSVQWLEQGLESDLFLLQCCAALAPPEFFIKRIQERFGLSSYTSLNISDSTEYEPVLVQEMLTLIIQIVKERRFCGLSVAQNLQRELVYKLSVGDATHSQLVKSLPRDLSKSDQLQNVLDMLAVYSVPSGLKQGKYSLHKAYWKELDLYHPRWNSKDLQLAEERYLRFCKVPAINVQLPQWTEIFEPLKAISRIATSKSVLQIIRAVLFYAFFADNSSISRAPDGVLVTSLHLLSLALDICNKQKEIYDDEFNVSIGMSNSDDLSCTEDLFPILTYASEEFHAGSTEKQSMLSLLVSLMRKLKEESHNHYNETRHCNFSTFIENLLIKFAQLSADCRSVLKKLAPDIVCRMQPSPDTLKDSTSVSDIEDRRAKARERQAAILEKMRVEQSKFVASLKYVPDDEVDISISNQEVSLSKDSVTKESVVCSLCRDPDSRNSLCYLILLQKSRITSFVERGLTSWDDVGQSEKEFLSVRKGGLINPSGPDSSSPTPQQLAQNTDPEFDTYMEPVETFLDFLEERIAGTGTIQPPHVLHDTSGDTTLEMMESDIYQSIIGDMYALDGEKKNSTSRIAVDSINYKGPVSSVVQEYAACLSGTALRQHDRSMRDLHLANLSSGTNVPPEKNNQFGPRDCDGIHISSCGHAVHRECHDRYLLSLKQRNIRRLGFEGGHIVDPDMGELLCPVCRRFANSILPASPGASNHKSKAVVSASIDTDKYTLRLPLALSLLESTSKMVGHGLKFVSRKPVVSMEPALETTVRKLCALYDSRSYNDLLVSRRLCPSLILWDTLRYSLASAEIASRGKTSGAVGSTSSLEVLYGDLRSSCEFILSLLLRVADASRGSDRLGVLLRYRGIQLLAGSICSGSSGDKFSRKDNRSGSFSSLLGRDENGETFPDILFWKRAADPILAHDPFSSLMCVLFCLPLPFISSIDFFIPLVQLFYVVCVVQAMITCYNQQCFDISSFGDSLLSDVCKTMGESELGRMYFFSNHVDSSCHPKDMIRWLTFPYLRKCALLWKLLQSSSLTPSFGSSHMWEGSSSSMINDTIFTNPLSLELNGVREMEDMFKIHSLELVLKDVNVHNMALKWCEHFCEDFHTRKLGGILFSTPAVPFKLMKLPRLYQDLLERYIKLPCSYCKSIPDEPALCLLCGKLCSPSFKPCCRPSKCLNHAMVCGAGIGVFLLVRKTVVLLQRSSRQTVWPSPYLDAFGEEDLDMTRGRPLYLSEERYAALTYLVVSHGLDRSSEVLRQTTINLYNSE